MADVSQPVTASRTWAYASLSLADVKRFKDVAGVKLNDVVLAVCAGALRGYLAELPAPRRPRHGDE